MRVLIVIIPRRDKIRHPRLVCKGNAIDKSFLHATEGPKDRSSYLPPCLVHHKVFILCNCTGFDLRIIHYEDGAEQGAIDHILSSNLCSWWDRFVTLWVTVPIYTLAPRRLCARSDVRVESETPRSPSSHLICACKRL